MSGTTRRPALRMTVEVGLERLLYLAATDGRFREALLEDRAGAVAAAGLALSDGEAAVLACVDRDALAAMIDAVTPRDRPQRPFLRSVALTFLALATTTADVACGPVTTKGIEPDWDPGLDRDAVTEVGEATAPDVPLVPDSGPIRGIDANVQDLYPAVGSDTWEPDADPGPGPDPA